MKQEPVWIRDDVVTAVHERQIAEHGGETGVRDPGLLESALHAPKQRYHYQEEDIPALAAAYAFSLARNHPFVDGNKRTAYVCMRLFLNLNGHDITANKEEKVRIMTDLSAGAADRDALTDWVRAHLDSDKL